MLMLIGFLDLVMITKPIAMPGPPRKHCCTVLKLDTVSTGFSFSLNSHFSTADSVSLRIHKFVAVKLHPGEDVPDYLVRAGGLSQTADFGAGLTQQNVREEFCVRLAMNGRS